jgi:acetolactate decarboxylase
MKKSVGVVSFFLVVVYAYAQQIKVAGTMRGIMQQADLSAKINLDTLQKGNLYALGPVAGLKGELLVLDGEVYSSSMSDGNISDQQNKVSLAAMLVYSYVKKWKVVKTQAQVNDYEQLEELVSNIAKGQGYDLNTPFVFRIEVKPAKANYHIIDWRDGVQHTFDNHKQFAYSSQSSAQDLILLGFYSTKHQGIFTHHTSNMHIHVLGTDTKTVGHLDGIQFDDSITVYLSEQ